jgi:HEPN domain-containing protein
MADERNWLNRAEHDLKTSKVNLEQKIYDAAAFYCQQSVEKALKALYIKQHSELVKAHDLNFLGRKVDLPQTC